MPHVVVLAPPCPPRIAPDLAKEETQHMTIQDPLSIAGQQNWMQLPVVVELFCMRQKKAYQKLAYWCLPVVPHKAVAEVSKIGNLWERLVVVNQGWQSESTDGPKGA